MKFPKGFSSTFLAMVFFLLTVVNVQAVPNLISYQGYLADNGGQPANGQNYLTFRLYDAETGGNLEWQSGLVSVDVVNGTYSVNIGENPQPPMPASLFAKDLWLSVQVGGDPDELSPRHRLTSVPYTLKSGDADTVDGQHASEFQGVHSHSFGDVTGILSNSQLSGTYSGTLNLTNASNTYNGNGSGLTDVNAANLSGKSIGDIDRVYRGPQVIDSVYTGLRSPSMSIPADGLPVIAYANYSSSPPEIRVAKCGNPSCTEGTTVGIANGTGISTPSVSIGSDGLPVIAYGEGLDMMVIHCTDASCSTHDNPELIASGVATDIISSITGSGGFPIIAFGGSAGGGINIVECSDFKCSSSKGPNVVPSPDGGSGRSWSLAMGGDGFPMFLSCAQNETRFHHCQDSACESIDPYVVIDSPCQLSSQNLITGKSSLPLLAYAVSTGLNVRYCANQGCTVMEDPVVLDSMVGGMAGSNVGITLAPGGRPMVTYGIQTLRVARCNSPSCDTGFNIGILDRFANDNSAQDGALSDVEIGGDGIPVVAYFDLQVDFNHLLKIARHEFGWVRLEDILPPL